MPRSLDYPEPSLEEELKQKIRQIAYPKCPAFCHSNIELADVLMALEHKSLTSTIEFEYAACASKFSVSYYEKEARQGKYHEMFWNLQKDFDGQEESVKMFLIDILL